MKVKCLGKHAVFQTTNILGYNLPWNLKNAVISTSFIFILLHMHTSCFSVLKNSTLSIHFENEASIDVIRYMTPQTIRHYNCMINII